jgi:predicted aspartyl protease/cytochrome c-type biogenesis protein CcmH/NrfG
MIERISFETAAPRLFASAVFAASLLAIAAQAAFAVSCNVVHHAPPTEADKVLLGADYAKAETLYREGLAVHPGDADLTTGLVHALLRQQKVQEAADAVKSALAVSPNSAALIVLRGEVEFRQGMPWIATQTAQEANKLDPCNPRLLMLFADIARLSSLYATAQNIIDNAHKLDPEDPEIRGEWISTLPLKQSIQEAESYLAQPTGDDAEDVGHLHMAIDHWKKLLNEPHKPCHLVSSTSAAEIPFIKLMYNAVRMRAFGLEVKLDNHVARLQIDTGAGGLVVTRSIAEHAGLKAFSQSEMSGVGDKGEKAAYTAYVDSIRIGGLEFQDCMVEVLDSKHGLEDVDGLIGMDVFSRFLVTLDFPMRKLILSPLPQRPGEGPAPAPELKTGDSSPEDAEAEADAQRSEEKAGSKTRTPTAQASNEPVEKPAVIPHGPQDRYIALEMKDYTRVYRVGHNLILPAGINSEKVKLFILDTGAWTTIISPEAAREVTKVHGDSSGLEVRGISGKVEKVYTADNITFRFANLSQKASEVVAFDTSRISKSVGLEISGFLGAKTLELLTIHIDYRDGLVKFDYDPNRGYKY